MTESVLARLNADLPNDEQVENLVSLAMDDGYDLKELLYPGPKRQWANGAVVLLMKGPQKTKPILADLITRIQDLNWPGSYIIIELLNQFPKEEIEPVLKEMREIATRDDDDNWLTNMEILEDEKHLKMIIAINHIMHLYWY